MDSTIFKTQAGRRIGGVGETLLRLEIRINPRLHDREIKFSNGWSIKIGRGFDISQRPDDGLHIGSNDLDLRPCLETSVDAVRVKP
jgi:ATP-dependent Lon protease